MGGVAQNRRMAGWTVILCTSQNAVNPIIPLEDMCISCCRYVYILLYILLNILSRPPAVSINITAVTDDLKKYYC